MDVNLPKSQRFSRACTPKVRWSKWLCTHTTFNIEREKLRKKASLCCGYGHKLIHFVGWPEKSKQKCEKKWVWIRREARIVWLVRMKESISSIVLCTGESHLGISMAIVYLWDCSIVLQTGYIYIYIYLFRWKCKTNLLISVCSWVRKSHRFWSMTEIYEWDIESKRLGDTHMHN